MTMLPTTKKLRPLQKLILASVATGPKTYIELLEYTEVDPVYLSRNLGTMTRDGMITRSADIKPLYSLPTPAAFESLPMIDPVEINVTLTT
jgi:hypothetical protein